MRKLATQFLAAICDAVCRLFAQGPVKPKPTFTLSIEEDKDTAQINPRIHRLRVKFTRILPGAELEQFHKEAESMYNMTVLRDGVPAQETGAMRELRNYRKADAYPTIQNPRALKPGNTWTTHLDVSDYYDMTKPGTYRITVTRESLPLNLAYSATVRSNTITVVVLQETGAPYVQAAEKPKPRFALTITTSDRYQLPTVMIRVGLENISSSVIREAKCWPFMGMYNFFVSRDGEPLEGNDEMQRLQTSRAAVDCPGNETLNEIDPGDIDADDLPVSNFFDISKPGSYEVYVSRETHPRNPAKSVLVESGTLDFVVPTPSSAEDTPLAGGSAHQ
jgi:hypothetical protein